MDELNRLPEVTGHVLSGLKADEEQKHRILLAASEYPIKRQSRRGTMAALCCLSVFLILLCALVSVLPGITGARDLQVFSAGTYRNSAPVSLQELMEEASELLPEAIPDTGGAE